MTTLNRKVNIVGLKRLPIIHIKGKPKNVVIDIFNTIRIGTFSTKRNQFNKFLISSQEDIKNEKLLNLME